MQAIVSLSHSLYCEWPEHFVHHLRPISNTVEEQCSCSIRKKFVFVFDYAILVVGANPANCDLLIFAVYGLDETIVSKPAIIGVVVFDGSHSLRHGFLHCSFPKQCLWDRYISHEAYVNDITDVINECCDSPEPLVSEETGYFGYQAWLR